MAITPREKDRIKHGSKLSWADPQANILPGGNV